MLRKGPVGLNRAPAEEESKRLMGAGEIKSS